eukprot:CAMPEP_0206260976 /NCGR_PEP_ID=MMETSP0047_2-20121206/27389_1 /ASSEMBLY_ACC=CAM_ASM_000192 /TAXON_ID=195065 /ORGANISM="Chroomonas mesostigmatica_cf, Strain CCMP1168" /LENGTH=159 /DNA_ID=CAMNT_0053688121 /DNA_START=166 /DNA_END=643 /DNA_ORIENTATION=+
MTGNSLTEFRQPGTLQSDCCHAYAMVLAEIRGIKNAELGHRVLSKTSDSAAAVRAAPKHLALLGLSLPSPDLNLAPLQLVLEQNILLMRRVALGLELLELLGEAAPLRLGELERRRERRDLGGALDLDPRDLPLLPRELQLGPRELVLELRARLVDRHE